MKILALDLSLTCTGWATVAPVSVPGGVVTPSIGTWRTNLTGMERLSWILGKVSEHAKDSGLVVMEGFSFGSKGQAVFEVAGLGYLVRYWLWKNQVRTVIVTPSQLKQFVTGKGNSPKEIMIREVYKRFGFEAKDNNEADACGLAYIGMAIADRWEPTTVDQRKIVQNLQNAAK